MNIKNIRISGTHLGTVSIIAPGGHPYRAIVYNPSEATYSGAYRY